jgi:hypothetical protein
MATTLEIDPITTDVNEDNSAAYTFEPWTDGHAIGFKVTRHEDDKVGYIMLNPSTETWSDGRFHPDAFVYTGTSPDLNMDEPIHFYNIEFGDED